MNEQLTTLDLLDHITVNIITGKDDGLVSAVATRRKPGQDEKPRADWTLMVIRGNSIVHVIGRGPRITNAAVELYVDAYLEGVKPWVAVDLSKMDMDPSTFETWRKGHNSKEAKAARVAWADEHALDFDNDPVWREIKKVAQGVEWEAPEDEVAL